eukprot:gene4324-7680_t
MLFRIFRTIFKSSTLKPKIFHFNKNPLNFLLVGGFLVYLQDKFKADEIKDYLFKNVEYGFEFEIPKNWYFESHNVKTSHRIGIHETNKKAGDNEYLIVCEYIDEDANNITFQMMVNFYLDIWANIHESDLNVVSRIIKNERRWNKNRYKYEKITYEVFDKISKQTTRVETCVFVQNNKILLFQTKNDKENFKEDQNLLFHAIDNVNFFEPTKLDVGKNKKKFLSERFGVSFEYPKNWIFEQETRFKSHALYMQKPDFPNILSSFEMKTSEFNLEQATQNYFEEVKKSKIGGEKLKKINLKTMINSKGFQYTELVYEYPSDEINEFHRIVANVFVEGENCCIIETIGKRSEFEYIMKEIIENLELRKST